MLKRFVCLAVVAAAAMASTAAADSAMTIRLGPPDRQAGVLIVVPVILSCSPFDPSLTLFSGSVNVSVEQASGKAIASGLGSSISILPQPLLFPCDDTEHTVVVNVLANTAGPPFHGGHAVFSASAFAQAGVPCGFPGCFFNIVSQSASVAPTPMTMH